MFDETLDRDNILDAVVASATIPVIFSPVTGIDDGVYVDGGVFTNMDMAEAILKCREQGFEDKDIIIDVIMCFGSPVELK